MHSSAVSAQATRCMKPGRLEKWRPMPADNRPARGYGRDTTSWHIDNRPRLSGLALWEEKLPRGQKI